MARPLPPSFVRAGVPLAPLTTLELGGPAEWLAEARSVAELAEALDFARTNGLAVNVLGGGSNVVVADRGVAGLVLRPLIPGLERDGSSLVVGAGVPWDDVVELAVESGLAGIECLSGIPGLAGAAPIQNIGAYGQEVGGTLIEVEAWEVERGEVVRLPVSELGLGYRSSRFKLEPRRWIIVRLRLGLAAEPPAAVRYAELERKLGSEPTLAEVRAAVVTLRRSKSMVLDPEDPNRRSVGSFFVNPEVAVGFADALSRDLGSAVPGWPTADGLVKLSAAWLIERAGFVRGSSRGAVGQSSRHALALVHHGGGSSRELLEYAEEIRGGVARRFGIELSFEPTRLGFEAGPESDSDGWIEPARDPTV